MKIDPEWLSEAAKRYQDYKEGRAEGIRGRWEGEKIGDEMIMK